MKNTQQENAQQTAAVVAAVQEVLPGKADAEGWRKLHPLSPIIQSGLSLLVILGVLIVNMREIIIKRIVGAVGEQAAPEPDTNAFAEIMRGDFISAAQAQNFGFLLLLAAVLVIVVLIGFSSWVSWLFASYRVTAENVEYRTGIIFKQQRVAPLKRIQGIDLERKLLARLAGLAAVKITTAGGEVNIEFLSHENAKLLRGHLLHVSATAKSGQQAAAQELTGQELAAQADLRAQAAAAENSVQQGEQLNPQIAPMQSESWLQRRFEDALDYDVSADAVGENLPVAHAGTLLKAQPRLLILSSV